MAVRGLEKEHQQQLQLLQELLLSLLWRQKSPKTATFTATMATRVIQISSMMADKAAAPEEQPQQSSSS
jgi:hypothetical protein